MLWINSDVCCGFVYQIADTEIGKFPILDTTVTPAGAINALLQTTARRASKPQQERLGTFASVSLAKAECQHMSFDHCGVTPVQRSLHTEPVRIAAATRPSMPSPSANPHAPKFNLHILAAVAEFERRHQQAHHGSPHRRQGSPVASGRLAASPSGKPWFSMSVLRARRQLRRIDHPQQAKARIRRRPKAKHTASSAGAGLNASA